MGIRHQRPYDNVLDLVGWTPLVRLGRIGAGTRTPLFGKAEFMNPGGSVKDRIGLAMIAAAEEAGTLKPGGVIVEATSGNTGLALAMAASTRGYRCIFTMPDKMSQEKVQLLRAFGAEVIITPTAVPPDHPDNYLMRAKSIVKETPGAVLADQFYNPANPDAHYRTTGPELWEQSEGRITHFFAGSGTGGTISGTARYLKEKNPEVRVVGVDPDGSMIGPYFRTGEKIEGSPYKVEGLGNDKIPGSLDLNVVDEYHTVSDRDAFLMARDLVRKEGLFVGGSTGLIVHAALEVAREIDDPDAFVVAVLCDWGEHYLTKLYDDDWMRENGFLQRTSRSVHDVVADKRADAPRLLSAEPGTAVRMALSTMSSHGVSQLPVLSNGDCVGSVTEAALMMQVLDDPQIADGAVADVMDAPFPIVDAAAGLEVASRLLARENPAVLVRRNGDLDTILTRFDLVNSLIGSG